MILQTVICTHLFVKLAGKPRRALPIMGKLGNRHLTLEPQPLHYFLEFRIFNCIVFLPRGKNKDCLISYHMQLSDAATKLYIINQQCECKKSKASKRAKACECAKGGERYGGGWQLGIREIEGRKDALEL
jgi:hypothetical protein